MALNYWNIFENASLLFAHNTALILSENGVYKTYSYRQLFEIANELFIITSKSTKSGEIIGIHIGHNELIPILLAVIHRCNCSFIFLDPVEDENHQITTITELNINMIFSISDKTPYKDFDCKNVLNVETNLNTKLYLWTKKHFCLNKVSLSNFAYFIKTSGSTSLAKNVAVTHQSIFPNIEDFQRIFNVTSTDVIYFCTPLTFDPSIIEIYLSAFCGAALFVSKPYSNILFPKQSDYPITIWQTTPSKFLQLGLDEIRNTILNSTSCLKVLALGGEPFLIYETLSKLKHIGNKTNIFNLYGITEISCWTTASKIDFTNCSEIFDMFIGEPLSHSHLKIMDDNLKPIKDGTGNIYIGSSIRKCLVGEEIIEYSTDKCSQLLESKEILWRNTGDIGEIKNNGKLYFKGRNDSVIKRFGSKICLFEIETVGLMFQGIEQCACLWDKNSHTMTIFFSSKKDDIKAEFSLYLRKSLPAIQMPDEIVQLHEIPISSHGKICKKKLLCDYNKIPKSNSDYNANTKDVLYNLLTETLLINDLGSMLTESFIGLGGNSIMAIQLINKFEKYTKKHYTDLFTFLLSDATPISSLFDLLNSSYSDINPTELIPTRLSNFISNKDDIYDTIPSEMKKRRLSYTKNIVNPISFDRLVYSFEVAWKIDLSKCVDASPVLYKIRGKTYLIVGSHSGKIATIDALSGSLIHILDVSSRVEAPALCFINNHDDPCAAVGDYSGCLWCFSVLDGRLFWKVSLEAVIKSQACCVDSNIYVATYMGVVTQINKTSGHIISSISIGSSGITADLLTSKLGFIFVASLNGMCACLDTNDTTIEIKWTHNLSSPVFAKPVFLDNESKVVFSEVNGVLHCLDSSSGNKIWTFSTENGLIFSSCLALVLAEKEYLVFGCHDCHTYQLAIDKNQKPSIENRIKQTSEVYATPCSLKGVGIVSISTEGNMQIIDKQSGYIKAVYTLPGKVFSSPVTLDDLIYAGCRDNYIYCLRIVGKNILNSN